MINLENGDTHFTEYGHECLLIAHTDSAVYSISTQKIGTENTPGLSGTALSPLRLRLRKKTQLVSFQHDLETGAVIKTDVLNADWPKGNLSLTKSNSFLFAILDSREGLSLYQFDLNTGQEIQTVDLSSLLLVNKIFQPYSPLAQ